MQKDQKQQPQIQPSPCSHTQLSPETLALIREVQRSISQNKRLFMEILQYEPNFSYKLYQPISCNGIDEAFLKPLILRQIDRLLEEKQNLSTKKEVLTFIMLEERKKKQEELLGSTNHYLFLRSSWARLQGKAHAESINGIEKLDNLNKIVGILKNNIKNLTENEHKAINKQVSQESAFIQSKIHERYREQLQTLKMHNEDLETKCNLYKQKLEQKNKKIEVLEHQLGQAGEKIKESISTLNVTSEKYQALKKSKQLLEAEVKRLQHSSQTNQGKGYVLFNSGVGEEEFKVRIEGITIDEMKIEETEKNLAEILQFLKAKPPQITSSIPQLELESINLQLQIPCLNLNNTQSTNETSVTERHFSKIPKYIPMRTQRSCLLRHTMSGHNEPRSINNMESAGEENEEMSKLAMETSQINITTTSRRFSRRADQPLTSDRFRKEKERMEDEKVRVLGHQVSL